MEQLLHYCWKHRMLPLGELYTTDGEPVEVVDPGLHNRNSGPDFFNAKIRINGTMWVGNVEIHDRSTDWYAHGHQKDSAYDNVVLHVVGTADGDVETSDGKRLPQLELPVPAAVSDNYQQLMQTDQYPPCYRIIPRLSGLTVHAWMAALQTERLEQKTEAIEQRARQTGGDWEQAYFTTMARNYGFGINGDAFEQWAGAIPPMAIGKHRDDLFQIEAIFLGQDGLLDPASVPLRHRAEAEADDYFRRLGNEYRYLAHKFGLQPMDWKRWRFLRLRPQNFPHIRIAQLARLYYERRTSLSQLTACTTIDQLRRLLDTRVTPYWETHYTFGNESERNEKRLSAASVDLLVINTAVPVLFAYGRHTRKEELCDRAFDLLEQLKPEQNHIVRMWRECGMEVRTAGDSQALIQLKHNYCDRRDCLRCRIGYEYLKKAPHCAP